MFNNKDIISKNIKILNKNEVSIISNKDEDYIHAPLTVEGGGVFKKGLAIGSQEKMVPGLIIYDSENFYGFSEKYGLSLFSTHTEYIELNIPNDIFEIKEKNTIQPTQKNSENFKNLVETEKVEEKTLNIDLEIKDVNNFYIIIPETYDKIKSIITFNINYIYDLNNIISNLSLIIINKSNKAILYKIMNDNCYYDTTIESYGEFEKNTISKIFLEIINEKYFILSKNKFIQK